jgi:hypothetical protein
MKNPVRFIFIVALLMFVYLAFDRLWGISSRWPNNEVLSLWQICVTGLGFIAAVIMVAYAANRFIEDKRKEEKARSESLSQITHSLKSELELNRRLLAGEYKIWQEGLAILVRPLKTSSFELIAGREDLKYLGTEAFRAVAEAYDQIKDFNNVLNSWISRAVLGEEKGHYPSTGILDLSRLTSKQLDEELKKTMEKIDEALRLLQRITAERKN